MVRRSYKKRNYKGYKELAYRLNLPLKKVSYTHGMQAACSSNQWCYPLSAVQQTTDAPVSQDFPIFPNGKYYETQIGKINASIATDEKDYILRTDSYSLEMVNTTNHDIIVEVYKMAPKFNVNVRIFTDLGITSQDFCSLIMAFMGTSPNITGDITDGTNLWQDSSVPFWRHETVQRHFKVLKSVKKCLKPGDVLRLFAKGPSWKKLKYENFVTTGARPDLANDLGCGVGKCWGYFIRAKGVTAHDTTVADQIGTGPVGLDVVVKRYLSFYTLPGAEGQIYTDGINDTFTNGPEQIVNEQFTAETIAIQ